MQDIQAVRGAYDYVRDGGVLSVLVFFILGGFKQWWVFGHTLTRERQLLEQQRDQFMRERDSWQRIALGATLAAEKAVEHAAVVQKQIA